MIKARFDCSQVAAQYPKPAKQTANVSQMPALTIWDCSWLSEASTIRVDFVPSTKLQSAKRGRTCS